MSAIRSHLEFAFGPQGKPYSPTILIYGCDHELLTIRTWMLETAEVSVLQAYEYGEAESIALREQLDAILLCHSVPQDAQSDFLRTLEEFRPTLKCLCLDPVYNPAALYIGASPSTVLGLGGLINRVRSLLEEPGAVLH